VFIVCRIRYIKNEHATMLCIHKLLISMGDVIAVCSIWISKGHRLFWDWSFGQECLTNAKKCVFHELIGMQHITLFHAVIKMFVKIRVYIYMSW